MNQLFNLDLTVVLRAPYLVHGSDAGRLGLDATLLTDHRGTPVLPGTLLAGRIAETAWLAHRAALGGADADKWFGRPGFGGTTGDGGTRARLRVQDLQLKRIANQPFHAGKPRADHDIARIEEDADRGAVVTGALLIIEQLCPPRAELEFQGRWQVWATPEEAERLSRQVRAALQLQTQLGAYRGIGFGQIVRPSVQATLVASTPIALQGAPSRRRFVLRIEVALCVGARSRRGNVFVSSDVITGGTIRGALARMVMSRAGTTDLAAIANSPLAQHFEQLRCTHALPAAAGAGRPIPLPQSLVHQNDHTFDARAHAQPPAGLSPAPAFQTDWKPEVRDLATKDQGWGQTLRHLRVRTDIDERGQAKDQSLFAYQCIAAPADVQGRLQTEWLFDIDLGAIDAEQQRAAIWAELGDLLGAGLAPLGKTDARAEVSTAPADSPANGAVWPPRDLDAAPLQAGEQISIVLVSDALLFPTNAIADKGLTANLGDIYANAFDQLLQQSNAAGALHYSHHFATQRMAGGKFSHSRRAGCNPPCDYQPLVLTEAGSVFVFTVQDAARAARALRSWQVDGLPLTEDVMSVHGASWKDHAYLRENGYGEIAVEPAHGFAALASAHTSGQEGG